MKIIHAADLHLGQGEREKTQGRGVQRELFFQVFEDLLKLAEEEAVDLLLLAGDILESSSLGNSDIERLRRLLEAPRSFGILAVAGNHDPHQLQSPWIKLGTELSNFYLFSSREIERLDFPDLNLSVYGTSFHALYEEAGLLPCEASLGRRRTELGLPGLGLKPMGAATLDAPLSRCLGLVHGDLGSGLSLEQASEGRGYNRLSLDAIRRSELDFLALGHYHRPSIDLPQRFSEEGNATRTMEGDENPSLPNVWSVELPKVGRTQYAYSGTPQGAGFDELGPRGVLLLEWNEPRDEFSARFHVLSRQRYEEVPIALDGCCDDGEALKRIMGVLEAADPAGFEHQRYKLQLRGQVEAEYVPDLQALDMRLKERLAYVEIQDLTRPALDLQQLETEESLRGAYARALSRKGPQEVDSTLFVPDPDDGTIKDEASPEHNLDEETVAKAESLKKWQEMAFDLALRYGLEAMRGEELSL